MRVNWGGVRMKIRLALLENDQKYLNKVVAAFNNKLADKLEIYSFTSLEGALAGLESNHIDIFLANDSFEINCDELPARCGFAYFSESLDIESIRNQRTICKFQKVEFIYKEILGIYSESATNITGLRMDDAGTKIICFVSPGGGVGTSTVAASCARFYAKQGKKTLYLNIDPFENVTPFFQSEGQTDFSDILYAIKSKKSNLGLKLESVVRQDASGVHFYASSKSALDILGMTGEEFDQLLTGLKTAGAYDYIIIDPGFSFDKQILDIMKESHVIVFVTDGSEIVNGKFQRAYTALQIIEQEKGFSILNRSAVLYNQFNNQTSKSITFSEMKNIGGVPRYERATTKQVMEQLSNMQMFQNLLG